MAIIKFDYTKVKDAIVKIELAKMQKAVNVVEDLASDLCPMDKGNLKDSFSTDVRIEGNEIIGIIKNSAEYAAHVEFGTKPHEIRPREKKALAWGKRIGTTKKGNPIMEHVAKVIRHPGTQGIPFMRGAMISKKREVEQILQLQ